MYWRTLTQDLVADGLFASELAILNPRFDARTLVPTLQCPDLVQHSFNQLLWRCSTAWIHRYDAYMVRSPIVLRPLSLLIPLNVAGATSDPGYISALAPSFTMAKPAMSGGALTSLCPLCDHAHVLCRHPLARDDPVQPQPPRRIRFPRQALAQDCLEGISRRDPRPSIEGLAHVSTIPPRLSCHI